MGKMTNLNQIRGDLNLGDYGEFLNDYRNSDMYLSDAITEIADSKVSIYYDDIKKFISRNYDYVERAIDEFGWDGCGKSLMNAGQCGEMLMIQDDIYEHIEDTLLLLAIDYIEYDIDKTDDDGEVPEELIEYIESFCSINEIDMLSEIPDKIDLWFEEHETQNEEE